MFGSKDLLFSSEKYGVAKSLRFRSGSSTYLNRTPASAGDRTKWTWSGWVKRGQLTTPQLVLFSATSGVGTCQLIYQGSGSDSITFYDTNLGPANVQTTPQYRDPSAWYHVVCAIDTAQGTASNRVKIYVNGVQVTAFSPATYPGTSATTGINNNVLHGIGTQISNGAVTGNYFDGYMAEVNFIDGQALTPSSFGFYDNNGIWQPQGYTGTYGTNGFYLKFTDVGATASPNNTGYGKDFSGFNTNYWTTNNFNSTSTSTSYDSMYDSPVNASNGITGIGNYCVLNPVLTNPSPVWVMSNGNLTATRTGTGYGSSAGTIGVSSGKWYFEAQVTTAISPASAHGCGFTPTLTGIGNTNTADGYVYFGDGTKKNGSSTTAYGASWTTGNIIGVALDLDAGTLTFYKDNVSQGTAYTGLSGTFWPVVSGNTSTSGTVVMVTNFGQQPFAYTPPSGYSALNTQNLTAPTIAAGNKYFDATLWSGNGSNGRSITNSGAFQPDLVWIKNRSSAISHILQDAVRGVGASNALRTDTNGAESGQFIDAINNNGFTVNGDNAVNGNTYSYVGWQWNAGGAPTVNNSAGAGNVPTAGSVKINGADSTSTLAGTIAATRLSANTSAGFSVVTYTGTGANATVGHGLGVKPAMIIVKARSAADNWQVTHQSLNMSNQGLYLNATNAVFTDGDQWNSTQPTSSVFSLGALSGSNTNGRTYVAYLWSAIANYSSFGSYTGNASTDGPFVYTGFRPRWIMLKRTDAAAGWYMEDTSRNTYNVMDKYLTAESSDAESTLSTIDSLSNGFKLRASSTGFNASGGTYIYAAFAENPFKISRAR